MAFKLAPYKRNGTKIEATNDNLVYGLNTASDDDSASGESFRVLNNVLLNNYGSIKPRYGYERNLDIVSKIDVSKIYPAGTPAPIFDKNNVQGVFYWRESTAVQYFFMIDGFIFNSNGNNINPSIKLWVYDFKNNSNGIYGLTIEPKYDPLLRFDQTKTDLGFVQENGFIHVATGDERYGIISFGYYAGSTSELVKVPVWEMQRPFIPTMSQIAAANGGINNLAGDSTNDRKDRLLSHQINNWPGTFTTPTTWASADPFAVNQIVQAPKAPILLQTPNTKETVTTTKTIFIQSKAYGTADVDMRDVIHQPKFDNGINYTEEQEAGLGQIRLAKIVGDTFDATTGKINYIQAYDFYNPSENYNFAIKFGAIWDDLNATVKIGLGHDGVYIPNTAGQTVAFKAPKNGMVSISGTIDANATYTDIINNWLKNYINGTYKTLQFFLITEQTGSGVAIPPNTAAAVINVIDVTDMFSGIVQDAQASGADLNSLVIQNANQIQFKLNISTSGQYNAVPIAWNFMRWNVPVGNGGFQVTAPNTCFIQYQETESIIGSNQLTYFMPDLTTNEGNAQTDISFNDINSSAILPIIPITTSTGGNPKLPPASQKIYQVNNETFDIYKDGVVVDNYPGIVDLQIVGSDRYYTYWRKETAGNVRLFVNKNKDTSKEFNTLFDYKDISILIEVKLLSYFAPETAQDNVQIYIEYIDTKAVRQKIILNVSRGVSNQNTIFSMGNSFYSQTNGWSFCYVDNDLTSNASYGIFQNNTIRFVTDSTPLPTTDAEVYLKDTGDIYVVQYNGGNANFLINNFTAAPGAGTLTQLVPFTTTGTTGGSYRAFMVCDSTAGAMPIVLVGNQYYQMSSSTVTGKTLSSLFLTWQKRVQSEDGLTNYASFNFIQQDTTVVTIKGGDVTITKSSDKFYPTSFGDDNKPFLYHRWFIRPVPTNIAKTFGSESQDKNLTDWLNFDAFKEWDYTKAPTSADYGGWTLLPQDFEFENNATILAFNIPLTTFVISFGVMYCEQDAGNPGTAKTFFKQTANQLVQLSENDNNYNEWVETTDLFSCKKSAYINGSLFLYDGDIPNRIYFSMPGNQGYFPSDYYIDVPIDIEEKITKIVYFSTQYVIFCENSIWKLTGENAENYAVSPINLSIGCIDGRSAIAYMNYILFVSNDGVYKLKGLYNTPDRFDVAKISTYINNLVPYQTLQDAFATINENKVYFFLPNISIPISQKASSDPTKPAPISKKYSDGIVLVYDGDVVMNTKDDNLGWTVERSYKLDESNYIYTPGIFSNSKAAWSIDGRMHFFANGNVYIKESEQGARFIDDYTTDGKDNGFQTPIIVVSKLDNLEQPNKLKTFKEFLLHVDFPPSDEADNNLDANTNPEIVEDATPNIDFKAEFTTEKALLQVIPNPDLDPNNPRGVQQVADNSGLDGGWFMNDNNDASPAEKTFYYRFISQKARAIKYKFTITNYGNFGIARVITRYKDKVDKGQQ